VRVPGSAEWLARYSRQQDEWGIELEFDFEDVPQLISWIVDDDSGGVTQTE
jgi:hypothetical protein